jgi:hypothetical protein
MGATAIILPVSATEDRTCVKETLRPMFNMAFEVVTLDAQACQER